MVPDGQGPVRSRHGGRHPPQQPEPYRRAPLGQVKGDQHGQ